ncbi:MAG TPA: hypothetical protein PKM57_11360 [Kiritimatiellia bacterium]|nr:hypothetical protein [Kiritimatiellia bacterium]HPS09167.1 hypothetical protein [Kiritimatiellia bacterium]
MLKDIQAGLCKRWRLRLKAGALALAFAFFSVLPWLHVITLDDTHAGHGCCHQAASAVPVGHLPVMDQEKANASDTCWICQSLVSLLQHNEPTVSPAFIGPSPSSSYMARAPHAPVIVQIYPASRSQAPPALA